MMASGALFAMALRPGLYPAIKNKLALAALSKQAALSSANRCQPAQPVLAIRGVRARAKIAVYTRG